DRPQPEREAVLRPWGVRVAHSSSRRGSTVEAASLVLVWPAVRVVPTTSSSPRRRMSSLDAPTITSTTPGSTTREKSRPVNDRRSAGRPNVTLAASPAASVSRRKPLSSSTGRVTEATGWRTYSCTTSSPSDRKSTRLNSSHGSISYAVFCLQKKIELNRLAYELRLLRQLQPLHRTIRHLRRAKRHALPACLFEDARHPRVNHLVVADVVVDG